MTSHKLIHLPIKGRRMSPGRKQTILRAIEAGQTTDETVIEYYNMSLEELEEWRKHYSENGVHGLKVSKQDNYPNHKKDKLWWTNDS